MSGVFLGNDPAAEAAWSRDAPGPPAEAIAAGAPVRRFKPYPAYRDSGVEWLGDIPAHWEVKPLKRIGDLQGGAGFPEDDQGVLTEEIPFFKVGDMAVPGNERELVHSQHTVSRAVARRLRAFVLPVATIVFAKVGAALLLNRRRLLIRPSCVDNNMMGFLPVNCDPDWALYWLSGLDLGELANPGAVPSVNEGQMRDIPAIVPPEVEQRGIAGFLDRETGRIDALVAKKEKLIALLQEKRTALITRSVTKGLAPAAAMKDSGTEWLGQIPAHWDVNPLKAHCALQTGLTLGKRYEGIPLARRPYLRVANVQDGYLALDDMAEVELPPQDVARYELQAGDVLMTEGGDFDKLGRGHLWEGQIEGCLHQNHLFAVRPQPFKLDPRFLSLVMSSGYGRAYFTATSKQSTNLASTNSGKIRNFPLPMPSVGEQNQIVSALDRESARIDGLIATIRGAIERMREFRTALISAAVTGKIDVREEVA